ncbi:MAG: helix-turn-helix domain-containing protein [Nitrospirae bacterium]|nr:helix-turn-helix domain-containing protein [Nitrospirota bacterium]
MPRSSHSLRNNLKQARGKAGITQGELASQANISRQAYSSLESGNANPSTEIALRLAQVLGERVESLFYLPGRLPETVEAELIGDYPTAHSPGGAVQRARLFRVGKRLLARHLAGPDNARHALVAAEGLIVSQEDAGQVTLQPFDQEEVELPTLSMLGCDPAVGLLEAGLRSRGVALVAGEEGSRQALLGLARGEAHVAGCHLLDDATGTYNSFWVRQLVPFPCTLVTFASWEQGLIVASGNPKQVQGVPDLANPGSLMVNRQAGSGSR